MRWQSMVLHVIPTQWTLMLARPVCTVSNEYVNNDVVSRTLTDHHQRVYMHVLHAMLGLI